MKIRPFKIAIPDGEVKALGERLSHSRFPNSVDENWQSGPPTNYIESLILRFQSGYHWSPHEDALNRLPQFSTKVDGLELHFVHSRSQNENAIPLLLLHGWPSSFLEFVHLIEPLIARARSDSDNGLSFHLVIPSLPGFVFSSPLHEGGWNNRRIAAAMTELMTLLGYQQFGVHGGDAGAIIGPEIGRLASDRVIGIHLNAATMGFIPMGPIPEDVLGTLTAPEKLRVQRLQRFMAEHFGFNAIQSTRPQALAYGLSDSPVGALAWMSELFTSFGDRPDAIDADVLITNFLLYWFTNTMGSSIRLYFENAKDPQAWAPKANSGVPTAVAVFQNDEVAIRRFGEQTNNIVRWTEFDRGGHFAAVEEPQLLAADIRAFFSSLWQPREFLTGKV